MFISHISSMDTFARGLKIAARIRADGHFKKLLDERYRSFDGVDLKSLTFPQLEALALKSADPKPASGQQEAYEMLLNHYV